MSVQLARKPDHTSGAEAAAEGADKERPAGRGRGRGRGRGGRGRGGARTTGVCLTTDLPSTLV